MYVMIVCDIHEAVVLQTRGIGQVPDISFNVQSSGGDKECTLVIAEGRLRRLYMFVRFDDGSEVQASIRDMFMSIRVIEGGYESSLLDSLHKCFLIGGYNHYESDCEYAGEWPEASIFSPDDNPLEVANYYLDFSDIVFGQRVDVNESAATPSSTYELCLGNGWTGSLGEVQYSGNLVFSDSELIITALPPTPAPSSSPSSIPSAAPTSWPSSCPSSCPTSPAPSFAPSISTTSPTSINYKAPSVAPSLSAAPSCAPSFMPTTHQPTSSNPSSRPTNIPSPIPSFSPSLRPTASPTDTRAPSGTPLLLDSACDAPQSLTFRTSLGALESVCTFAPMSGSFISSVNVSLLFTRDVTSFTESPSDLAIVFFNTATGDGLQVGGTTLLDARVTAYEAWPSSWHHMHVSAGVSSKTYSALLNLSSYQLAGGNVYSICLINSYYFSDGVQYFGNLVLGGVTTACDIQLPVPSAPPTLLPSLSVSPTQRKRQILSQSNAMIGTEPSFSFDALLSGGESVCIETSDMAGVLSAIKLQLKCTYFNDNPGASWASDVVFSITNKVNGAYGNDTNHCAFIAGEGSNMEMTSCFRGGVWPTVMNTGVNKFDYTNISVVLGLPELIDMNFGDFNKRMVGAD